MTKRTAHHRGTARGKLNLCEVLADWTSTMSYWTTREIIAVAQLGEPEPRPDGMFRIPVHILGLHVGYVYARNEQVLTRTAEGQAQIDKAMSGPGADFAGPDILGWWYAGPDGRQTRICEPDVPMSGHASFAEALRLLCERVRDGYVPRPANIDPYSVCRELFDAAITEATRSSHLSRRARKIAKDDGPVWLMTEGFVEAALDNDFAQADRIVRSVDQGRFGNHGVQLLRFLSDRIVPLLDRPERAPAT